MNKEELKNLGLNEEQVERIFEDYGKNYVSKAQFNSKNEELKRIRLELNEKQANIEEYNKKLEGFKDYGIGTNEDIKSLQAQLKALKDTVDKTEKMRQEEKTKRIKSEIDASIVSALTKGNAHDPKSLAKILNQDVLISDDGEYYYNADDGEKLTITDGVNKWLNANLWAVKQTQKQGGSTTQSSASAFNSISKADFQKMTYAEKVNLYKEKPEIYKELTKGE